MGLYRFKINYEVQQKRKVEKFIDSYAKKIEFELLELKINRYWKIEKQFQAVFLVKSKSVQKEKIVYEILRLANILWSEKYSNWEVNGSYEMNDLHFECILNSMNENHPLKWAHIQFEKDINENKSN